MEVCLKKKIEFVCDLIKTKPKPLFFNGNVISIAKKISDTLNLIVIKDITFLAFNYSNELYIKNLNKVLEIKDFRTVFAENLKVIFILQFLLV